MSKLQPSPAKVNPDNAQALQRATAWVDQKLRGKKRQPANTLGVCMRLTERNANAALVLHWLWFRHRNADVDTQTGAWVKDTVNAIADALGLAPRTVERALTYLNNHGWVETEHHHRNGVKLARRRPIMGVKILLDRTQDNHLEEHLVKHPEQVEAHYRQIYAAN